MIEGHFPGYVGQLSCSLFIGLSDKIHHFNNLNIDVYSTYANYKNCILSRYQSIHTKT